MKWGQAEKDNWFKQQRIKRSYKNEVCSKIEVLQTSFDLVQYGALSLNPECYPLYLLKTKKMDSTKKTILITGGVHGYETSGVHGALGFLEKGVNKYRDEFNFVCVPCVSPWAYETINRWNPKTIDPNRSFYRGGSAEECQFFLKAMADHHIKPWAHFDLHETTDTDNSVFLPALSERDGVAQEIWEVPDGFYLVGDGERPQKDFQKAIVDAVKLITHIAPHDEKGHIIGVPIEQEGVINYPIKKLFLCAGFSDAEYVTTTEVYPDSPKVTAALCIEAQITAIRGGLDFLIGI